jgi:hypothetical protein
MKNILSYYREVMDILTIANEKHGYGAAQGIISMAQETLSYNFRQELAHQIYAKELKQAQPQNKPEEKKDETLPKVG